MNKPIRFGKYLLLQRISVGGMAEVYKAKSFGFQGFEKIIAIKRILPTIAEDDEFIKMFIDEAKIAVQLSHANICQIFELGCIDTSHFIAMEFINGKDLLMIQNRFRKLHQIMPVPMAVFLASKICESLDYAHRKTDPSGRPLHIVHRDISPQNIIISYEGEVKLIDFGIAKAATRSQRTQAGVLKGKFGYMSPEQVRGFPLDHRSDIFSTATVLHEMVTGEKLFVGESDFSTLEKVRNAEALPPRHVNPLIPEEVNRIVMKGLTREAGDRYQTASEMQEDLMAFLLSQREVYTTKKLSQWMKATFAMDIQKEKELDERLLALSENQQLVSAPIAVASDQEDFRAAMVSEAPLSATRPDDMPLDIEAPSPPPLPDRIVDLPDLPFDVEPTAEGKPVALEPLIDLEPDYFVPEASPDDFDEDTVLSAPAFDPDMVMKVPVVEPQGAPVSRGFAFPFTRKENLARDVILAASVVVIVVALLALYQILTEGDPTPAMVSAPVAVAKAQITVVSSDGKAIQLLVDGTKVGEGPQVLAQVSPGGHDILVMGAGGQYQEKVALAAGEAKTINAALQLKVVQKGKVKLKVAPSEAKIEVDGHEVKADQGGLIDLAAGEDHAFKVSAQGYVTSEFSLQVSSGQVVEKEVALAVTKGTVRINSTPSQATIYINNARRGSTPVILDDLDPTKKYKLVIKKTGHKAYTQTISFQGVKPPEVVVEATLKEEASAGEAKPAPKPPKPTAPPAASKEQYGYLVANTLPWATVWVDGKNTNLTTPIPNARKLKLTAGMHKITFVAGGKKYNYNISIRPNETYRLIKQLSP